MAGRSAAPRLHAQHRQLLVAVDALRRQQVGGVANQPAAENITLWRMAAAWLPGQPDGERRVCPPVVAGAGGGDRAGGGDAPVLPRPVPELLNRPVGVVQHVFTGETVERALCREAATALLMVSSNIVG